MARVSGAIVAAVTLGGCFLVLPKTETHHEIASHETVPQRAPAGPVALAFRGSAARLAITATQPATCRDDLREVDVQRTHTHARFVAWLDDDTSFVIALMLAPFTIPVTGLYTVIDIAASNDAEVRTTVTHPGAPYACTTPVAGLALELVTPDGAFAHGTTDAAGTLELPLDSGLPPGTAVRISATGELRPVQL